MAAINGKSTTQRKRRDQEAIQLGVDSNSGKRIRRNSGGIKCKPLPFSRNDRSQGNTSACPVRAITGGILEQLIAEAEEEISVSEARVDRLRQRLQNLKGLASSLGDL